MTNREALDIMKMKAESDVCSPEIKKAYDMAISALEKQEPMKPSKVARDGYGIFSLHYLGICPICNAEMSSGDKYCGYCGQRIIFFDWDNEEDGEDEEDAE